MVLRWRPDTTKKKKKSKLRHDRVMEHSLTDWGKKKKRVEKQHRCSGVGRRSRSTETSDIFARQRGFPVCLMTFKDQFTI